MPLHAIRLRAAWEIRPDPGAPWSRVGLPLPPASLPAGPAVLRRRFRPPPLDPETEELWLVLEQIPGVHTVDLNGREWSTDGLGLAAPIVAGPTNLLELRLAAAPERPGEAWGVVRLEIRARGEV